MRRRSPGFQDGGTMKTIALDAAEHRIAEALKHQGRDEPILLRSPDADGLILRLPEGMKDSDVDQVLCLEAPGGPAVLIIQAKHPSDREPGSPSAHPVFGSCQGMISIVSE